MSKSADTPPSSPPTAPRFRGDPVPDFRRRGAELRQPDEPAQRAEAGQLPRDPRLGFGMALITSELDLSFANVCSFAASSSAA
jgi:hypothetical protein